MKTQPTSYWTLFCNPRKWRIDDFLASGLDHDYFSIMDWQVEMFGPGQLGVIRVGTDTRTKEHLAGRPRLTPGIYAIVEVMGRPTRQHPDDPLWLMPPSDASERLAVPIRYIKNLSKRPLLLSALKDDPAINDRFLLVGFQASSMPLDPATFGRVFELAGAGIDDLTEIAPHDLESPDALVALEQKYAGASPEVQEAISWRIERGPVGAKVKEANGYRCQICLALGLDPIAFVKRDGSPYVEAHHVTFVSRLDPGSLGPSNIITVCPNHHRQLHYGDAALTGTTGDGFLFILDGVEARVTKFGKLPTP